MKFNLFFIFKIDCFKSSIPKHTYSAASDGVEALKSDTKSQRVKSVSCPIADIVGILLLKIFLIRISSLKADKSSKLPPPLARIIVSISLYSVKSS